MSNNVYKFHFFLTENWISVIREVRHIDNMPLKQRSTFVTLFVVTDRQLGRCLVGGLKHSTEHADRLA